MILINNEPLFVPKFISAQKLLEDKFILEFPSNNEDNKKKIRKRRLELTIGDIACFVKPHSDFVCDTIVRGILPKRHNGLESPKIFVLFIDNKFDIYIRLNGVGRSNCFIPCSKDIALVFNLQ